ncbi:MAG: hypothetical protein KatS3mg061_0434 [Dehalococcoidia bacterium]|nr:MAG: hypothetical protein KatS3mg061_0434 [Dehalococcoidia bacterium]
MTVVIVTHDLAVTAVADRVIRIRDGRVSSEAVRGDREEFVVIDSLGRLQLPATLRDQYGLVGRARRCRRWRPCRRLACPPGMNIVRAEGLRRTYRSPGRMVTALDGVSLVAPAGALVAITGRSGSGKTTLLNLLGGLDRPDAGHVWNRRQEITALDDHALTQLRRGTIGYIFQSFGLLPTLSAAENVALPLRIAGIPAGNGRNACARPWRRSD